MLAFMYLGDRFSDLNTLLNIFVVYNFRNNAGKFCNQHALSEDRVEMTFATNYIGFAFFSVHFII